MSILIKKMEEVENKNGFTAKGAKSNKTSLNSCIDLFGQISSMRARSDKEVICLFTKAFYDDPLTALKIIFWSRDCRGGAGERKVPRTVLKYLAENYPNVVKKNLSLISEFGRWDDYLVFEDTPIWEETLSLFRTQLNKDLKDDNEYPSLLAKWLPSNNTSSKNSKRLARKLAVEFSWTDEEYRKNLAYLREKIRIVESKMCAGEWKDIDYEKVPSRAAMIYRNAFKRHDELGYSEYLKDVESGKKEIKAATLYPYDIVRKILSGYSVVSQADKTLSLQWDALPNYVEPFNGVVVCDTSGSMYSSGYYGGKTDQVRPIDVAVSLAIYIAERNESIWKDKFITFSSSPTVQSIKGSNIFEKVGNLSQAGWSMSTDLISVFNEILKVAVKNDLAQSDIPERVFIISDMQFDHACQSNKRSNFEQIDKKFKSRGYVRPQLVFWNVNAYGKDSPVTVDDTGTCLVSGASPSILKSVLSQEVITPVDIMNETINSERYNKVKI